jgi:hypothetical protein
LSAVDNYEFLRVEEGRCEYAQGVVQPVAVFAVDDRRREIRLSQDVIRTRLSNRMLRHEEMAMEEEALDAIQAYVDRTTSAHTPF